MKRRAWIIPVLGCVVAAIALWIWSPSKSINSQDVIGRSESEIRSRYGEPDWVIDNRGVQNTDGWLHWVYYSFRQNTSLAFAGDRVANVYHTRR